MIDRRELLSRARERRLPLAMIEKDYMLGWVLFGLTRIPDLVFKGGTALAKVYFPQTWRLSEDLDFVTRPERFNKVQDLILQGLEQAGKESRIRLILKSRYSNSGYLQLKIQYFGPLCRNWLKVDVTPEL